jgi:hypothetical protein
MVCKHTTNKYEENVNVYNYFLAEKFILKKLT